MFPLICCFGGGGCLACSQLQHTHTHRHAAKLKKTKNKTKTRHNAEGGKKPEQELPERFTVRTDDDDDDAESVESLTARAPSASESEMRLK